VNSAYYMTFESEDSYNRHISKVEREAAARALIEAADALNRPSEGAGYEVWASGAGDWLRARAAEYRKAVQ
jgi:hypothetical protein